MVQSPIAVSDPWEADDIILTDHSPDWGMVLEYDIDSAGIYRKREDVLHSTKWAWHASGTLFTMFTVPTGAARCRIVALASGGSLGGQTILLYNGSSTRIFPTIRVAAGIYRFNAAGIFGGGLTVTDSLIMTTGSWSTGVGYIVEWEPTYE